MHSCIIHSPSHGYWQCGQWMPNRHDATVYRDATEATGVIALRKLPPDATVVSI